MKNYQDSDYALNKYSEDIVYRFADGIHVVTLADYLAENPDKTEADFHEIKKISDEIYLEQVQDENTQTRNNSSFDELDEMLLFHLNSPENIFIYEVDEQETAKHHKKRMSAMKEIKYILTEKQWKRYLHYHVDGLSMREIAKLEGKHFTTIEESLQSADKKIKKFFTNSQKHPYKTLKKLH